MVPAAKSTNQAQALLGAAHEQRVTRVNSRPWPGYAINALIAQGFLKVADPGAEVSLVVPTAAGLAKLGKAVHR